jgi:SAM-dependent methyltransferase
MPISARYGRFARLYHELFEKTAPSGDEKFYAKTLLDDPGVPGAVLEPACGAGRVMIPLLEAGFSVCGFDASPEMIALAKVALSEFPPEKVQLLVAQMTDFKLTEDRFDAAILPNNAIGYLTSYEEKRSALLCINEHLKPGARLLLDRVANIELVGLLSEADSGPIEYANEDGGGTFHTIIRVDEKAGTIEECLRWDWTEATGQRDQGEDCDRFRFLPVEGLCDLLQECGFTVESQTGDFDGEPFDENSLWAVIHARKN